MTRTLTRRSHCAMMRAFVPLGAAAVLVIAATPATAQIGGASVSTTGSTANSGDADGEISVSAQTLINNGTTLRTRFAWNLSADVGVFSTRDTNGNAQHNVAFNVTAPGAYVLTVDTSRSGDMNRFSDAPGCDGAADITSVSGGFTGGTLASGSLGLGDPGSLPNGGSTTNVPFSQVNTGQINGTSNGVAQPHTLTYTWSGTTRSNSCEAAVRLGETSTVIAGCTGTCVYPGNPARTQANDGHFSEVTFTSLCGNGTIDSGNGEQCDTAIAGSVCCASTCLFATPSVTCRPNAGVCDQPENCNGSMATCPTNQFQFGNECRPSAGVCDIAETCNGVSASCPANGFEPTTTVCRPGNGVCDQAENCTGSANCPADGFLGTTVICRPSVDVCDLDDRCTGSGANCPSDGKSSAVCRPSAGVCDVAESCNGVDDNCPGDDVAPDTTICRGAAGVCDLAENCDGATVDCSADAKSSAVCRGAAGVCDVAESCDGAGDNCPADQVQPTSVECRASAGVCDVAENCDGAGTDCPSDGFESSAIECRPTAGVCDVAENCTGSAAACPSDAFEPTATVCRGTAGVCDLTENCPGNAAACPVDAKSTASCRPAAGVCDVAESCDGVGDDCPSDGFASTATVCRGSADVCDVAENCPGGAPDCPADDFEPTTTVCRPAADDCDAAENCTGSGAACPGDGFQPDGTSCDDTNVCTEDDACQSGVCVGDSELCGDGTFHGSCNEECDDGNTDPGDGCSATCQVEPGLGCGELPFTGCRRPFVAQKSSLLMQNKSPDDKDTIKWKWLKGERTTVPEYGDPLTSTNYQLCVYHQGGFLMGATAPAGGTCAGKPCWKAAGIKGFKYKDKELTPNGVQKIILREGPDGKAKIQVSAKGLALGMPDLSTLVQPITVQIQNSSGLCWEAIYSAPPTLQDPTKFKDRAD